MKRSASAVLVLVALSGCAIQQKVTPVSGLRDKQICVIQAPAVRAGFLEAYKRALSNKGFMVRELPPGATPADCPVTTTYTANWRWDLAMYMAYAEITVYNGGQVAGKATYDSLRGGGNMNKFIEADKKIAELVGQLFP